MLYKDNEDDDKDNKEYNKDNEEGKEDSSSTLFCIKDTSPDGQDVVKIIH